MITLGDGIACIALGMAAMSAMAFIDTLKKPQKTISKQKRNKVKRRIANTSRRKRNKVKRRIANASRRKNRS